MTAKGTPSSSDEKFYTDYFMWQVVYRLLAIFDLPQILINRTKYNGDIGMTLNHEEPGMPEIRERSFLFFLCCQNRKRKGMNR